jgi:hypothetical protein
MYLHIYIHEVYMTTHPCICATGYICVRNCVGTHMGNTCLCIRVRMRNGYRAPPHPQNTHALFLRIQLRMRTGYKRLGSRHVAHTLPYHHIKLPPPSSGQSRSAEPGTQPDHSPQAMTATACGHASLLVSCGVGQFPSSISRLGSHGPLVLPWWPGCGKPRRPQSQGPRPGPGCCY